MTVVPRWTADAGQRSRRGKVVCYVSTMFPDDLHRFFEADPTPEQEQEAQRLYEDYLAALVRGEDGAEAERIFRENLEKLLGPRREEPRPIGPDIEAILQAVLPGDLAKRRQAALAVFDHEVRQIRKRAVQAFGELVLREIEYLVLCGWNTEDTYLPAVNNLAVRKREIQGELVNAVERLQEELKRRLLRLVEEREDRLEG